MSAFTKFDDDLRQLRYEHAFLCQSFESVKALYRARKYNPNQPRVSAGNPDGGRWTSSPASAGGPSDSRRQIVRNADRQQPWEAISNTLRADGSIAQQTVLMRDGSAIRSEFAAPNMQAGWDERHLAITPEGSLTVFENSGDVQTIKDASGQTLGVTAWTSTGAEPEAFLQPAYLAPSPRPNLPGAVGAALTLFAWMSSQNSANSTAVIAFRGGLFTPGATDKSSAIWVGSITKEQADEACPRRAEVQSTTDQAAELIDRGRYDTARQYGTAVHNWIKTQINGPDTTPESPPHDPNFRAEVSFIKSEEVRYGKEDSTRVDVYENPRTGTVCVHDVKTGDKPLTIPRMFEIATNVQRFYPGTRNIIVTEVRPRR